MLVVLKSIKRRKHMLFFTLEKILRATFCTEMAFALDWLATCPQSNATHSNHTHKYHKIEDHIT